jgi:predicted dinucleotide-binding enzyme
MDTKTKIGILGSGDVGKALGRGFAALGCDVKIGSREPAKLNDWVAKTGVHASLGSFAEAAKFGDVIVVATLWSGTESALRLAGAEHFRGKVVIDATNPLVFAQNAPPSLALGHTDSGGEQVQRWLPGARVVKCFNIVGNAHMFRPELPGGPPTMFYCGNDADAKRTVAGILDDFGWPGSVDLGGIEGARLLEPMCIVWVISMLRLGSGNIAFKLLRR